MPRTTSNRKDEVRKAAARLFRKYSYSGTSMDALAAETQLNKGTLYHYYRSKADILYDIVLIPLQYVTAAFDEVPESETPADKLRALMHSTISLNIVWADEVAVYFQEQSWIHQVLTPSQLAAVRQEEQRYSDRIEAILTSAQQGRDFVKIDTTAVRFALVGMVGNVSNWFHENGRLSVDDLADVFSNLVLRGLEARLTQPASSRTAATRSSSSATSSR